MPLSPMAGQEHSFHANLEAVAAKGSPDTKQLTFGSERESDLDVMSSAVVTLPIIGVPGIKPIIKLI
jgi:hypothetical protein